MEDSRNIVKAIDALTEKAGGQKKDSLNIIDAIDNLRNVFSNRAITEDEVEAIIVSYLDENPITPDNITQAVNAYLDNNPIDISSVALSVTDDEKGNVTICIISD